VGSTIKIGFVGEKGVARLDTGPFLKAAAICSDVIEGKDGVLSLIRIIDRLTITAAGTQLPAELPPQKYPLKIVLMLISGRARGSHSAAIRIEQPDTTSRPCWSGTVFLEGEDRGANVVIALEAEFPQEGLYWFDLYFDDARITRMPFRVIYQRAGAGPA